MYSLLVIKISFLIQLVSMPIFSLKSFISDWRMERRWEGLFAGINFVPLILEQYDMKFMQLPP